MREEVKKHLNELQVEYKEMLTKIDKIDKILDLVDDMQHKGVTSAYFQKIQLVHAEVWLHLHCKVKADIYSVLEYINNNSELELQWEADHSSENQAHINYNFGQLYMMVDFNKCKVRPIRINTEFETVCEL